MPVMAQFPEAAFPKLNPRELELLKPLAKACVYADGETVFRAGEADLDLCVVESGKLDILNPTDRNRVVVTHQPGEFSGDIDLLTGRPVIVTAIARGETHILRVPGSQLRSLLNRVPSLGERLMNAFTSRRELLSKSGVLGLRVVGPGHCRETNTVREFLYKNFVPFTWFDPAKDDGKAVLVELGSPKKSPVIECGNGTVLVNPSLRELAAAAGIWRHCPNRDVDLAIVGAGPAGITAAVYAASEGLSTIVLDRLGPGGQASGSSRIENFIGFPAGLSGAELATRGVLQMLKFGATMIAPVSVEKLTPASSPDERHLLHLDCGATIRSRVVLIAVGVNWRRLEATGADRFEGAGIYYACTTVEADLYDKQDVVVVGAGNSAGQAVMFLAECCPSRNVHMVIRRTLGLGISEYLANRIKATSNVVVHDQTEIDSVYGGRRVEAIELRNNTTDERQRIPCGAIFVFIGAEPSAHWLPAQIARDSSGYVLTGTDAIRSGQWPRSDRDPCPLETTLPGVLVGGDIRSGSTKRVGFAVGDGSLAVTCVHRLLSMGTQA
jgi:thioredoxin reductase (NADPH)